MSYFNLQKHLEDSNDSNQNNLYVVANISNYDEYEKVVDEKLSKTFIDKEADSIMIASAIEKIEFESLQPYIVG